MKIMKKLVVAMLLFAFIVSASDLPAISNPVIAQAATIKISTKTLSLDIDKTVTLKISGTKKTVKWSTSDKDVATVSGKGKVKGIAAGKATITAKVAGKNLTCKVTVKETNPLIKDAPFKAKEITIGNIRMAMPMDWTSPSTSNTNGELSTGMITVLTPKDTKVMEQMQFTIAQLSDDSLNYYSNYDTFKTYISGLFTQDVLKSQLETKYSKVEITSFEQTDMETAYGKVLRTDAAVTADDLSLTFITYDLILDKYIVELVAIDGANLNLEKTSDYIINTMLVK